MKYLLVAAIVVVVVILGRTEAQANNDVCRGVANGFNVNNPARCRAFWTCQNGVAWDNECAIEYNFNQATQLCDPHADYPCFDLEEETTESEEKEEEEDIVQPPETEEEIDQPPVNPDEDTTLPETGLPDICVGRPNGHLLSKAGNCGEFFVCVDGVPAVGECPPNQNFNEISQACDSQYPCDISEELCPPSGIDAFEVDGSCTDFNFCFAGYHSIRQCADGLHFNSALRTCDYPEYAKCKRERCPASNDPNNIVTYASENNCEEFYICYSGQMLRFSCAAGLYWDQRTQNCERPINSDCPLIEVPVVGPSVECPHEAQGLHIIAHPTDCSKYYVCSFNTPVLTKCMDGLLFDDTIKGCNIADRVDCFAA